MKEFVEKLIEQLEKRKKYNADMLFASNDCFSKMVYEAQMSTYENSIRCVNQLAEEYKQCDLCYAGIPCEYQNKDAKLPVSEFADKNGWIPCEERYPDTTEYILLSFSNFSIPVVGRWEEDKDGGAFYIGDEMESCASQGMIVNAWQQLPKVYRMGEELQERSIG